MEGRRCALHSLSVSHHYPCSFASMSLELTLFFFAACRQAADGTARRLPPDGDGSAQAQELCSTEEELDLRDDGWKGEGRRLGEGTLVHLHGFDHVHFHSTTPKLVLFLLFDLRSSEEYFESERAHGECRRPAEECSIPRTRTEPATSTPMELALVIFLLVLFTELLNWVGKSVLIDVVRPSISVSSRSTTSATPAHRRRLTVASALPDPN